MSSFCMCGNDNCPCINCATVDYDYGGYHCIGCISPRTDYHWYDAPLGFLLVLGIFMLCMMPGLLTLLIMESAR